MRRVGTFFLGLGVAIGMVGAIALAVGFRPSTLPAALLDISVYKLVFIASACVLAAGALVRRTERRRSIEDETMAPRAELGEGPADFGARAGSVADTKSHNPTIV